MDKKKDTYLHLQFAMYQQARWQENLIIQFLLMQDQKLELPQQKHSQLN